MATGHKETKGMLTDITTIIFPDGETERRALRFLIDQYWGTVFGSSEHMPHRYIVPDTALAPLREAGIPFTSRGHSTLAERMEKLQGVDLVFNKVNQCRQKAWMTSSMRSFVSLMKRAQQVSDTRIRTSKLAAAVKRDKNQPNLFPEQPFRVT